jgi:hypothetical protein
MGWEAWRMRYITGSRRLMLAEAMSIFARNTRRAVRELALAHPPEEVEVLVDRAIAERAFLARLGQGAAVLADLIRGEVVDVGEPLLHEQLRPLVELVEIVGRVVEVFPQSNPSQRTSSLMESMYSCSSLVGFVSSKRRWVRPPNSWATPKFRQIDLACPTCR